MLLKQDLNKCTSTKCDTLVLFTEIRWLSKGKVLLRFYDFRKELLCLFSTEKSDFVAYLNGRVVYQSSIFG